MSDPFGGDDLSGQRFARAKMRDVHFDAVDLTGARFFAVLEGASFTDTNLADARFEDVNLVGSSFTDVNISDAAITNANLSGMHITQANMTGFKIDGATLVNADIRNAEMSGMRIDGVLVSDLFAAYQATR